MKKLVLLFFLVKTSYIVSMNVPPANQTNVAAVNPAQQTKEYLRNQNKRLGLANPMPKPVEEKVEIKKKSKKRLHEKKS